MTDRIEIYAHANGSTLERTPEDSFISFCASDPDDPPIIDGTVPVETLFDGTDRFRFRAGELPELADRHHPLGAHTHPYTPGTSC